MFLAQLKRQSLELIKRQFVATNSRRCFGNRLVTSQDDSGYEAVPHYRENSAIFIARPEQSPFQNVISSDVNIDQLFQSENMQKSCLNVNLTARHGELDLNKLKEDYNHMKKLEAKIESLEKEKESISASINNLIKERGGMKCRKATMQSEEGKELIEAASNIKKEISKIEELLIPIKEIVNIACNRMPNSLHFSTLYTHSCQQNPSQKSKNYPFKHVTDTEDNLKPILFEFNIETFDFVRNKVKFLSGETHWERLLNDSIVVDSKLTKPNYSKKLNENWSFVEQANSDLNTKYMTGTYAKLEHALCFYLYDKLSSLNSFEHIKSASLFKSPIVEGCGQAFNDPFNLFNVVRFGQGQSKQSHSNIELLHLSGSSSLQALTLNFVRTLIKEKHLPWSVYTNGKVYTPKKGQRNSYDILVQCANKSSYIFENESPNSYLTEEYLNSILTSGNSYLNEIKTKLSKFVHDMSKMSEEELVKQLGHDEKGIDEIFVDLCKMLVYIYKDFHIPMRIVCLNANELKQMESFKCEIQAYVPSQQNYITVGKIVLMNDYVSKRLQIRIDSEENKTSTGQTSSSKTLRHTHMIYARLMNVNAFMQSLIETNLVKIDKTNNNMLLLDKSSTNDICFVLPDLLKKYYHF